MFSIKKNIHWKVWVLISLVLAMHVYVLRSVLHFEWANVLQDGISSSIIISLSVWSVILLVTSYPTTAAIYPYSIIVAIIISGLTTMAVWEVLKLWAMRHDSEYKTWVVHTLPIRFVFILILNLWMATNSAIQKNILALEARFQQQTDASVLLKEAELFKLRQQLQPHFLYNSLNSINALILISPDSAQEMIGKLSDFLRSSVQRESEDTLPVREELNYIRSYLSIESVRFGDRLRVNIENEPTGEATMPPFLLQPILENAIKFGLYGNTGIVNITISIECDAQLLTITITNPYDADTAPPPGTGFGLQGIRRRLYLIYARTDLLETRKDGNYFTTVLKIPQHVQSYTDRR